jgi:vanillate O-demethylase ferredoxin subunit
VGDKPVDGAYRIAVRKLPDSRGGSVWIHELQPGAEVEVSEPQRHFELQYGRPEYTLVAGGIGITPTVRMAAALERHGRPYRLLYAGRTREQMPFLDEPVARHGHAWREQGRPPTRLRFETFASGGRFAPEPFVVRVRDRGDTDVRVSEQQTMLAALRHAGVDMMWDCLRGECGLCAVDVLAVDGELDHRDVSHSEEQQADNCRICTCVSRAVGGAGTVGTGFRGG